MSILKIHTYPDPILKEVAKPIKDFGPNQQAFFDDLIETMWVEDGVGLAAPQVGVSKRVFVAAPTMQRGEEYIFANLEFLEIEGTEMGMEGCLSLPGISGEVPRATKIKVRYQDRFGNSHDMVAEGFFARVIQHENDHLDGKVYIDRVDFDQRQKLLDEYFAGK